MKHVILGFLIVIVILLTPACASAPKQPSVDVSFWAADSASQSIQRFQERKSISCRDPSFDAFMCVNRDDVLKLYSAVLECQSSEKTPQAPQTIADESPVSSPSLPLTQ